MLSSSRVLARAVLQDLVFMDVGEDASQPGFSELLWKDLRLNPCQWEERPSCSTAASPAAPQPHTGGKYFELDALVGLCKLCILLQ